MKGAWQLTNSVFFPCFLYETASITLLPTTHLYKYHSRNDHKHLTCSTEEKNTSACKLPSEVYLAEATLCIVKQQIQKSIELITLSHSVGSNLVKIICYACEQKAFCMFIANKNPELLTEAKDVIITAEVSPFCLG